MKKIKTQVVAIYIPVQYLHLSLDEIRTHLFNGYVLRKRKLTKFEGNSARIDCRLDKAFWKMLKLHAKKENITVRELTESILFTELSNQYGS